MNFNKAGKYLSLALLVLAIFSISIGISVAAGENSSSTQAVDFNNHISYYNYSSAANVDHKPTSNLANNLANSNIGEITSGISFNLNNHTDSSMKDNSYDVALPNGNPVNANISHLQTANLIPTQTNVSQTFSEQLFNNSNLLTNNTLNFNEENTNQLNENQSKALDDNLIGLNNSNGLYKNFIFTNVNFDSEFINFLAHYNKIINTGSGSFIVKQKNNKSSNELDTFSFDRNWDELIELEFGSHNFIASKLLISNHLKAYNILNKKVQKISSFGYFNKNLLDNFSTVDLYKNKYLFINENQIIKNNNSLFYIFNNSKNNNSKIYASKLSTPESYSSDDNDNDEDEPSDSINLGNIFIFYFNSFETSNEFYKILDNTKFYGKLLPLKTSPFGILESYSINTDYFSNEITSFELVDIRNDSINFGIITDYSNLLNSNLLNFNHLILNNHVIKITFNSFNDHGIIVYYNIFTNFYNTNDKNLLDFVYGIVDMEVSYNDK
ncbi:hypothetical protein [Methanobrevibacter curvatus]|uniref:Uncharacterized protein n=1 Tax=Methanobrevibacter curvatus TaxID=49547 RepID=A0A162FEM7_9EURY|nr:hypothetical protein [Methanobrevibacter curvatus]KZX11915.1 hypothetical protein MBCUR_12390 [Methanobrevibacter curvatus]